MELVKVENNQITIAEEYLNGYAQYLKQKAQWELKEKEFKAELLNAMEEHGIKSYENDVVKVTYVAPTVSTTFDSKRFKEECEDLYEAFTKTVAKASYIKVTPKAI